MRRRVIFTCAELLRTASKAQLSHEFNGNLGTKNPFGSPFSSLRIAEASQTTALKPQKQISTCHEISSEYHVNRKWQGVKKAIPVTGLPSHRRAAWNTAWLRLEALLSRVSASQDIKGHPRGRPSTKGLVKRACQKGF